MISCTQSFRNKVQLSVRYRFISCLWLCLFALIILKLYLLQQKLSIVYVQQQKYLLALMKQQLRSKTREKQQRIHLYDNLRKIYQINFKIVLTYPTECQQSVYVCSSSALLLIKIMYPYHSLLMQHIKQLQNTISALFIFQEFGLLINYNLTTFGLPKCNISDNFIQKIVKILVAKVRNRSLDTANDYIYLHTILQSQFYLISCGPIPKVNNSIIFFWICTMNPFQVISSCQKTQNKIIHTLQESTVLILQQDKSQIFSSTKKSQSILKQKLQSSGIIQTQLTQEILIECFNKQNELQLSISEQLQLKIFQCSLYGPQQLIRKILFGRFITNIQSVYYQNHPKYFSKVSQLKDTYYVKSNTTTQKYLNSIALHGFSDIENSAKFIIFSIFLSVLLVEVSVFVVKWHLVPGINQVKRICKISKSSIDWSLCEEQIQRELVQNSTMIFQKLISYYSKFIWLRAVSQENGVEVRQSILKKGQKLFPQQQFQLATLYIYQELITLTSQQISYLKLVYHLPSCQLQLGSFNHIPTFNHILSSHLVNPHPGRIKLTAKPSISKNKSKIKRTIILNGVQSSQSEVQNESSQGKEVDLISRTNYVETTLKHILEEKQSQVYAGLTSLNYLRSQNTLHHQEKKQKLIGKSKKLIQQKIIENYQKIINQYDKIIDIKTKIFGQNPTTISINSIFELKAKKAKCTYKLLKKMINNDIQIEQNCLQTYLPQQNDQHQQDVLVCHLQYYHLFRMKTKCLLGIPISYKQLENLTFSQSNFIKIEAIYLLVQQLLKNKPHFDLQAVMLISQSLILNSSTNSYKYKMLNLFADCLANFEILDSQLSQIKLIRQFYNFKHRKFYFIADLSEGLDQLTPTLGAIYEEMGKLDLMSVFNLTGQKDGMLFVSEIIRPKRKDAFIALMEQLSLMKVHTEGKTTRKSLKQQYNFKKILNFITEEKTMFTKIIVLILGEGYTSNSILTEDAESLSNQKQLQQLIHAQITHEINQSYAHIILIGHQLNYYHTKLGKLKKYIKSSQHLLEIDLMQTDFSYHITQIHQFLHP